MARIVVCGFMVRHPVAGNLLAYFHYVLGLHRLGHEVCYVEESGWPSSCYDPAHRTYGDDPRAGMAAVRALLRGYGIDIPVCYVDPDRGTVEGAGWADVKRMLGAADLLLNVGGVCWLPEFRRCRRRALIDMDPFFTQVGRFGAHLIGEHHVHFSYGANIGRPRCTIPTTGVAWRPTVPPVVPELWAGAAAAPDAALTTVANWSAYGAVTFDGERYGQKDEEFLRLLDLPKGTPQRLELALSGAGPDVTAALGAAGWSLRSAGEVSADVATYRAYVHGSRGEFSVAKQAYVKTRSGWFSDRSVCYLAAGRPVILQDTGFSDWLPTGHGVLGFTSLAEAVDRIERVNAEYGAHCRAARRVAAQTFDYRAVLPRLLSRALAPNGRDQAGATGASPR